MARKRNREVMKYRIEKTVIIRQKSVGFAHLLRRHPGIGNNQYPFQVAGERRRFRHDLLGQIMMDRLTGCARGGNYCLNLA